MNRSHREGCADETPHMPAPNKQRGSGSTSDVQGSRSFEKPYQTALLTSIPGGGKGGKGRSNRGNHGPE